MGHRVFGEGDRRRRGPLAAWGLDERLAPRERADDRGLGARRGRHVPGPLRRHEPAHDPRHELPRRPQLLEPRHAGRQPLRRAVVVPHRGDAPGDGGLPCAVAAPRRRELPLRRVAEREADRHRRRQRGGLPRARDRRDGRREVGEERPRGARVSAARQRSRDHLRRLEPDAPGQGDGPVAARGAGPERSDRVASPAGGDEGPGPRPRGADREGVRRQRHRCSGARDGVRPDRPDRVREVGRSRRPRVARGRLHPRRVPRPRGARPEAVVARGLRRARAPRPRADGERRRRGQRPRVEPLRHPGVHRGRRRRRPPPLQGERPQHPRPWRGLDVRHDAPHVARAAGGRGPLREGHGPQHHSPRGQARGRALLRPDGPRGPARHARLVLLRHVGEVGQVDGRAPAGRGRLPPRPDPPPARPRLRLHVAQRERRSAPGERREGVPRRAPRARLPEPGGVVGDGEEGGALGSERDEDARAVRVGAARLLVHGHQARRPARLRHRDRPGAGAAPAREPAPLHSREGPLADQRHVGLSLRRWSLQGPEGLQRRDGRPLRPIVQRRGVRAQGAGRRLRVAPRDARELRRPQVRLDRDHPVDAQQRVARA